MGVTWSETTDEIPAAGDDVADGRQPGDVIPGRCAIHGDELLTHKRAGYRHYGAPVAVVCPNPEHTDNDRERCRYCGGPLVPAGTPRWTVSERRQFCTPADRLRYFRWAK